MTQDQQWDLMWKTVMNFFKKNRRRPSKYCTEERMLCNWVKYNIRRMRSGQMLPGRLERMHLLLDEGERLKRVNQYHYKLTGGSAVPATASRRQ